MQAVLKVLGDGFEVSYEHYTQAYFEYANLKKVSDFSDPLRIKGIIETTREYAGEKSLVELLANKEQAEKTTRDDFKFEVPYKTFIQKIKKHHGKTFYIDSAEENALAEKVVYDKRTGMADLMLI